MKELCVLLSSLLAFPLVGQANYVTYGVGCNNRGQTPVPAQIVVMGVPRLGTTIEIYFTGPTFSQRYQVLDFLVTGLSRIAYLSQPLPIRIPSWLLNYSGDCDLLCSVEWMVQRGLRNTIPIDIPNNTQLIGLKLYQQGYLQYIVTGSFPDLFTIVTNGVEMTIGL